jgi:hypothetical protein
MVSDQFIILWQWTLTGNRKSVARTDNQIQRDLKHFTSLQVAGKNLNNPDTNAWPTSINRPDAMPTCLSSNSEKAF